MSGHMEDFQATPHIHSFVNVHTSKHVRPHTSTLHILHILHQMKHIKILSYNISCINKTSKSLSSSFNSKRFVCNKHLTSCNSSLGVLCLLMIVGTYSTSSLKFGVKSKHLQFPLKWNHTQLQVLKIVHVLNGFQSMCT